MGWLHGSPLGDQVSVLLVILFLQCMPCLALAAGRTDYVICCSAQAKNAIARDISYLSLVGIPSGIQSMSRCTSDVNESWYSFMNLTIAGFCTAFFIVRIIDYPFVVPIYPSCKPKIILISGQAFLISAAMPPALVDGTCQFKKQVWLLAFYSIFNQMYICGWWSSLYSFLVKCHRIQLEKCITCLPT